jgi:hypothetical protein
MVWWLQEIEKNKHEIGEKYHFSDALQIIFVA